MKKLNIIIIILLIISNMLMNSCENFLDLQEDPNLPGTKEIQESVIFPALCAQFLDRASSITVAPLLWNIQRVVETATPSSTELSQLTSNDVNTFFNAYTRILLNARNLESIARKNGSTHYQGIAELMQAYGWATLTDFFGKVPYKEAFRFPEIYHPNYDDQSEIYAVIEELIDKAIVHLEDTKVQAVIGKDDLIYNGDITKWTKLAYSFKARYAMRLSYAPGKTKAGQADIVLAALAKGITSNADNALFKHYDETGSRGWVYERQRRLPDGYIATNQVVNMMKATNDPRMPIYFTKDYQGDYSGLRLGDLYAENQKPSFVARDTYIFPDMPSVFMTYAECKFLEAEAYVFKGNYNSAKIAFELAVNADMNSLSVSIPQSTIDAFLAQFNFANNEENAQNIIITQKYLANFYETAEIHFDKIRTGYPIYDYAASYNPNFGTIAVPRQLPYVARELDYNDNVPKLTGNPQTNRNWWDAKAITDDMR